MDDGDDGTRNTKTKNTSRAQQREKRIKMMGFEPSAERLSRKRSEKIRADILKQAA